MCGIGGIIRFDGRPVEQASLERMRHALACRGPDGHGFHIDGPCGLVHTRLAVIDPAAGHQPMRSENLAVVFNGEIYNHRELRRELEGHGHRFVTDHSDTEVLLHGYRQWGKDLPRKLCGMFAFALWDGRELFLARDRVGKKPLYCWHSKTAEQFVFASTIAGVLPVAGLEPQIDRTSLLQYLALGYTQHSLLVNVQEIPPGSFRHMAGPIATSSDYWKPPAPAFAGAVQSNRDLITFRGALDSAVESRLEADVPLGCFLSGGIDSSLIAAVAQRKLVRRSERLRTFSVSMPDPRYDEAAWARRVAQHIGADHTELQVEPSVEEDLLHLIGTAGEPTGDSSILPTYWLSRAARQHVTVALSGDGGDELFGGYERYLAMRLLRTHAWWIRMIPARWLGGEQKSHRARLLRLIQAARQSGEGERYGSLVRLFSPEQLTGLGFDIGFRDRANLAPTLYAGPDQSQDPADLVRWWDFLNYLPFDLLRKVDRASMAVALEVRCPFLDTSLVHAALSTPMKVLVPGWRTKALLRSIAASYLPREIVERKKMGFAVPIGLWFRDSLRPLLHKWLLDSPALPEMGLDRAYIEQLIAEHRSGRLDHTHRLFALLTLSMWRQWMNSSLSENLVRPSTAPPVAG